MARGGAGKRKQRSDDRSPRTGVIVAGYHSPMAWALIFTKLTVEIDGEPFTGSWRKRFVPSTPGDHEVSVYFKFVGQPRCAEASDRITVPDGGVVGLAFRAPNMITGPGTLVVKPPA